MTISKANKNNKKHCNKAGRDNKYNRTDKISQSASQPAACGADISRDINNKAAISTAGAVTASNTAATTGDNGAGSINASVSLNASAGINASVSADTTAQDELVDTETEELADGARRARLVIRRLLPNRRIDKYLQHRFPDFSRTVIQKLIKEHAVTVNGKAVKCSYQLDAHDCVDLILPPPATNEIPAEDIPLNVIYEDEHIIVINKQANIIVHPARGNKSGTLVNALVHHCKTLSDGGGEFRPGIVHRLDRNTTGVMVVAKTNTAHWRIAHQFEHRQTRKYYMAVVQGVFELDADIIDMPLARHPRLREKYAVRPECGKQAVSIYEVKKQYRGYALLKLTLKTGRTHQLRVHTSAIGHPIVADDMYGGKAMTLMQLAEGAPLPVKGQPGGDLQPNDFVITRPALHAAQLEFKHPATGRYVTFRAELPPDMQRLIALLDRYRTIS